MVLEFGGLARVTVLVVLSEGGVLIALLQEDTSSNVKFGMVQP